MRRASAATERAAAAYTTTSFAVASAPTDTSHTSITVTRTPDASFRQSKSKSTCVSYDPATVSPAFSSWPATERAAAASTTTSFAVASAPTDTKHRNAAARSSVAVFASQPFAARAVAAAAHASHRALPRACVGLQGLQGR